MRNELKIQTASEYFNHIGLEIDWDETGNDNLASVAEYDSVQEILSCESSVWALRQLTHSDGSLSDTMTSIRRKLINEHNVKFNQYEELQDFY